MVTSRVTAVTVTRADRRQDKPNGKFVRFRTIELPVDGQVPDSSCQPLKAIRAPFFATHTVVDEEEIGWIVFRLYLQ
jgi:hypothetical protein